MQRFGRSIYTLALPSGVGLNISKDVLHLQIFLSTVHSRYIIKATHPLKLNQLFSLWAYTKLFF